MTIEPDGRIRISVTAPPVEGAANDALIAFLSDILRIARRHLQLVRGEKSRDKYVCVAGLDRETIMSRLGDYR